MTIHQHIATVTLALFFQATVIPVSLTHAQEVVLLPAPGVMVDLSSGFTPPHLAGITVYPNSPLKFDFIINRGDTTLTAEEKQEEYKKLIKYFLASLAVPDENQWVNLSPYEKDRIVGPDFANTQMGRDLLGQDYILKQITSSLIYPEKDLGKDFWDKVYAEAFKKFGNTNVPVNTFNKVWIVPDSAVIFEKGNSAYVLKNHLKVMLEQDYVATAQNAVSDNGNKVVTLNESTSKVMRDVIIPVLEKEVNEGKNFANLRQVYSGMLLAAWYKRVLKESFLAKIYADKSKLKGVDQDPKANQEIYQRYLQATKKGVYNFIKEDVDKYTRQIIPRKYFSGGAIGFNDFGKKVQRINDSAQASASFPSFSRIVGGTEVDSVGILLDDMSQPAGKASADIVDIFSAAVSGVDLPLEVGASTEHIDIFSDAVADAVGQVNIPSNAIQDKEQLAARLATEIKFDPYASDLKDMGNNMRINMRRLYKYDGTTRKETFDEMKAILKRIADEVEFEGSKDQIEVFQEADELSSKFGQGRQLQYLGLKFKMFSVHFNTETNLKALGEKTVLILQNIIMERAKSRLDQAMIGIQDETVSRALSLLKESNIEPEYAAAYTIDPQMPVYREFLSFLIEEFGRLPFNNEVGKTFKVREDSQQVVERIKQYLVEQQKKLNLSGQWVDNSSQLKDISEGWSEVFKNVIYSSHQIDGVGYSVDLVTTYDPVSGTSRLKGVVLERRQVKWSKVNGKIDVFDAGFYTIDLRDGTINMDLDLGETVRVNDKAMTQAATIANAPQSANPLGGIDLNASKLNMQIKRDGNGIVLPLAQQDWENINILGLTPVILEIKPALASSILDLPR